jgi:hypothetical protein
MHCLDEEVVITAATKIPSEAAQVQSLQRAPNRGWRQSSINYGLSLDFSV